MSRSQEVQNLLDRFVKLDGAGQVVASINEKRTAIAVIEDDHSLLGAIANKVFAVLAYDFRRTEDGLLLTPRTTLNLYSRMIGKPKVPVFYGMDQSIEDVSVPDGICLKVEDSQEVRRVRRLHKYKLSPGVTDDQMSTMEALLNILKVCRNVGVDQSGGDIKAGKVLANLLGDRDRRPVVLLSGHEVHYTVPENSSLLRADLPHRVKVQSLPIPSTTIRELNRAVIEETMNGNLTIPIGLRVLRG